MILSTHGVVLHCMDYSETSVIVKVYTEQLGLQSYIGKGVRRKGANIKRNLFSPLSLINVVANHKEGEGLRVLREASAFSPVTGIASDMSKLSVSLFMSELLSRCITAQLPDRKLFGLIEQTVLLLNSSSGPVGTFPIWFTLRFAEHLGFGPQNNFSAQNNLFDLVNGVFCASLPDHPYYIALPLSEAMSAAIAVSAKPTPQLFADYQTRKDLLNVMLDYYKLHISNFGEIKSIQVLSEVLHE